MHAPTLAYYDAHAGALASHCRRVLTLRRQKVMLDTDLGALNGVEVNRLDEVEKGLLLE